MREQQERKREWRGEIEKLKQKLITRNWEKLIWSGKVLAKNNKYHELTFENKW